MGCTPSSPPPRSHFTQARETINLEENSYYCRALVGVSDTYPKGLTMGIWKNLTGPTGRKISLFAGEVVSYAGFTTLLVKPEWYSLLSLIGFCVVLILVLLPLLIYWVDTYGDDEIGLTFSLLLTNTMALPSVTAFAVNTGVHSDNALIAWLIVSFVITSLISRWSRKKLPGV